MDRPQPGLMNNEPPPPDAHDLWRHFSETYFSLRLGLAVLAFAFPAVLYFWGRFVHDLPLQPSMSAYFFAARATAEAGAMQCAASPCAPSSWAACSPSRPGCTFTRGSAGWKATPIKWRMSLQ
ncbi:hypothetical protein J2W49_001776 [Hydrogenophaga palleronii]|uniref:Uncharacterized protein n=1 Tax=Hydrogenophaga palleronii TaxID=65655 RepID=A0ABU1WLE4_9BURK|nr:hypothetical protein [Hydrogenophaga palleronii]MDR7149821.1 hypothetical protein [Hydrogenophaga palleronii]